MKTEKTWLQKIKEQLERKMTREIVQAIEDGAEYEITEYGSVRIDGVYLTPKFGAEYHGLILDINAPEIEKLFEPKKDDLEKRAEELRAELERIENELNSK